MPLDSLDHEFRPLADWPRDLHFSTGRTERILQNQLPPRPDYRSYTGSTSALATASEFAEPDFGDMAAEHRAADRERKRAKRVGA
jgi:hypothetical protein